MYQEAQGSANGCVFALECASMSACVRESKRVSIWVNVRERKINFVVWAANKSMGVYECLLVRNCECV